MATEVKLVCPECGADMSNLDPYGHALTHWPEYLDPVKSSKEAIKRQFLTIKGGVTFVDYRKLHGEVE